MRESILKGLRHAVGHWNFESSYFFLRDRFWWPNIRQGRVYFVKSWDVCQKTKSANRKELASKIPVSGLFHTWCKNFVRPLPRTSYVNQYVIVAVEQMSKWPWHGQYKPSYLPRWMWWSLLRKKSLCHSIHRSLYWVAMAWSLIVKRYMISRVDLISCGSAHRSTTLKPMV